MMGVVSDDEFDSQLTTINSSNTSNDKSKIVVNNSKIVDIIKGRGARKEVPIEIKKIISEESINGAPAKQLAEIFQVSPSSISAYKNDATSTASYNEPHKELQSHNNSIRLDITDKARTRLLQAIDSITPEKLADAKVRDAAGIAKDMSAVIKNLEPSQSDEPRNTNFVFFAPRQKQEQDYEVIHVRE